MKKGDIMTFKEVRENLNNGTIIHLLYFDDGENPEPDFDGFGELKADDYDEFYDGFECCIKGEESYPFPINNFYNDNELVEDIDNCGWRFTISKVIV